MVCLYSDRFQWFHPRLAYQCRRSMVPGLRMDVLLLTAFYWSPAEDQSLLLRPGSGFGRADFLYAHHRDLLPKRWICPGKSFPEWHAGGLSGEKQKGKNAGIQPDGVRAHCITGNFNRQFLSFRLRSPSLAVDDH